MQNTRPFRPRGRRQWVTLSACIGIAGCGLQTATPTNTSGASVTVSLINVTPFDISATVTGVQNDTADTVDRTVAPSDSVDVTFVCVGTIVIGDPLDPESPGVIIHTSDGQEYVAPFSIDANASYDCGDVLEVIVSGPDGGPFLVDVFTFTPPCDHAE